MLVPVQRSPLPTLSAVDERTVGPTSPRAETWRSGPLRLRLFLISYAPLLAILAVRFDRTWLWVTCGALALVGFVATGVMTPHHQRGGVVFEGGTVSGGTSASTHRAVALTSMGVATVGYLMMLFH